MTLACRIPYRMLLRLLESDARLRTGTERWLERRTESCRELIRLRLDMRAYCLAEAEQLTADTPDSNKPRHSVANLNC